MNYSAETLISDLDRCPHGRHAGDVCSGWRGPGPFDGGCWRGVSLGNPLLRPGQIIGTSISGLFMIRVPMDERDRHDIKAWYLPRREVGDPADAYDSAVADVLAGGDDPGADYA